MLRAFIASYRDGDPALRQAAQDGDRKALALAAHSIRGACATAGALGAAELAEALESMLEAKDAESPPSALVAAAEQLNDELARLAGAIAQELGR